MREVLKAMAALLEGGEGGTLATITQTTGSAYRRGGAKMLCAGSERLAGGISGGCLDSEVVARAAEVEVDGRPILVRYDTRAANDNVWGLGIGCQGTVDVLIEPLSWWRSAGGRRAFAVLAQCLRASEPVAIVTRLPPLDGALDGIERLVVAPGSPAEGDTSLDGSVREQAAEALGSGASPFVIESEERRVFVDLVRPPHRLIVFGAGDDAGPLVRMAVEVGMAVSVVDHRPEFARPERFPEADEVRCLPPESLTSSVSLRGRPAVVLMSHAYLADRAALSSLLRAPEDLDYVGVLGPKSRTAELLADLEGTSGRTVESMRAAIRTPVGLDLGSETPAEIALAVLAEILVVKNRRTGVPLRDKKPLPAA